MFHYTHPYPNTDLTHRPQALSPRDKYLAAIAQAKAAEAEYLAAETAQQEEAALRRRLNEIQLQKQHLGSPFTPYSYQSAVGFGHPYYQDKSTPSYELLKLQQQIEEEELRRRVVEERAQARRLAEEQVRLRLQAEQEERLRASAAAHQAGLEHKARIKRQAEAERFILALNRQAEKEQAALVQRQRFVHPQCNTWQNACHTRRQCHHTEQANGVPFHSLLRAIVGQDAAAPAQPQQKTTTEAYDVRQLPSKTHQASGSNPTNAHDIFRSFFEVNEEKQAPPESQTPAPGVTSIEDIFKHILAANQPGQQGQATVAPGSMLTVNNTEGDALKQLMNLFLGGEQRTMAVPKSQQSSPASSSSCKPNPTPAETSQPGVENFSQIFDIIFGQAAPQAQQQKKPAPSKAPAASNIPKPDVASSLKTQLETRLGDEYASEVRDTIQAILASLQDVPSAGVLPVPSASHAESSNKGKAKAAEPTASSTPSNTKDVSKAFDEVRSIAATFHLLETEFVFPSQLDFLTPSNSKVPTPASSDTESVPSSIGHLSYTSRNNPVRHYEQSLGALMSQLDAVESFGSEALRTMRKEVVGKVERALEELESEVEGRWRARVAKESKSTNPPAEAETTPAPPTSESTPAEGTDTIPEDATPHTPSALDSKLAETTDKSPEVVAPETTHATEATEGAQEITTESPVEAEEATPLPPIDTTTPETATPAEHGHQSTEGTIPEATNPVSLDASVATIKPYDVSPVESDGVDTFLLPASVTPVAKAKPAARDHDIGDAGSDWSEVEA